MPKKTVLPRPLPVKSVYASCPTKDLKFKTTKDLNPTYDFIAQERAVKAINLGLGIRRPGYNIYVAGFQGTGKTSVIRSFLERWSKKAPTPSDWVYVYNFDNSEAPKAIELPTGEAKKFKRKVDNLVRDLRVEIPKILQSEEYESAVTTYLSSSNDRKAKLYGELEKLAKSLNFSVKSTRMGIETIPILKGRPITEKEYTKLKDNERDAIETSRAKLEPEVLDFARKVRTIETETRDYLEILRSDFGLAVVGAVIDPLKNKYEDENFKDVVLYLEDVKEHVLENLLDFVEPEDLEDEEEELPPLEEKDPLRKYRVNVFVDNSHVKGAPVIIESNPTYYNLFGKVEKKVEYGVYQTDFGMIKSGSIHRANGGYLVLMANDIFRTGGSIWETLKRVLRTQSAFIEDIGEQHAMLPTSGLRPQPVPLDIKVILIGNDEMYSILFEDDEEFFKIFKIKAEFDHKMPRNTKNVHSYCSFVATRSKKDGLLDFDKGAVARIIEYGSRVVEDQKNISTRFGAIKDLTIEADFMARQNGGKVVKREDVEEALSMQAYRNNLMEEQLLDLTKSDDIMISLKGERVGQINALTVYDLGDYSFGKACRITCTSAVSDEGVLNIERASRLSGKSHDKGMMIITGFLNSILAREKALPLSASVCFEQSYGPIDGDSASMAELIAIISSFANIPIDQSFSITGSINQVGEAQAIGGVNEKIEGFFRAAVALKIKEPCSVIIPKQNVSNLMLHQDVVEAIKAGTFKIFPVKTLKEAFELITGVPLGVNDVHSKTVAPGSALSKVMDRIERILSEDEEHEKHDKHDKKK